jgi:hypothetical protein
VVQSLVSDVHSLVAAGGGGGATASQVWADANAVAVKSAAQQGNARALVIQSLASDTHSQAVLAVSAARDASARALVVQSLASDTHSQTVLATSAAREASGRALVIQSLASDTHSLALEARSAARLAPTTAAIADKVLGRNLAGGSDGGRTVQDALRVNRNKVSIASAVLRVMKEDDTSVAWSAAVTTDSAALAITAVDPT